MNNNHRSTKQKKVVVELFGEVQGWYDCISDVGRKFGHSVTTITNRIKSGTIRDGWLVRYPREGEDLTTIPRLSPPKFYGSTPQAKVGVLVDDQDNLIDPKTKEVKKKNEKVPRKPRELPEKPVVLDRERYLILKYEVRNIVQCITPCPFMVAPKAMVGSPQCQQCHSFKGRNKETHEVACSRKIYQ